MRPLRRLLIRHDESPVHLYLRGGAWLVLIAITLAGAGVAGRIESQRRGAERTRRGLERQQRDLEFRRQGLFNRTLPATQPGDPQVMEP